MITVDEILEIDRLVLRNRNKVGSPEIDIAAHRLAVEASKAKSKYSVVRRDGKVAAYGYLWPLDEQMWFVGGIAIHPNHRNPSVFRELAQSLNDLIVRNCIGALRSNVFKENKASVDLHRHLGFEVTRQMDVGFEFTLKDMRQLQRFAYQKDGS